jgi:hypothetical protein
MAGQLTIDTLRAGSGVLATQNGMTGIAKAWANYNGSTSTLNNSFNVSSVTKNSTGNYTYNFTTAMANANYSVAVSISNDLTSGTGTNFLKIVALTTTTLNVLAQTSSGTGTDVNYASISVFSS